MDGSAAGTSLTGPVAPETAASGIRILRKNEILFDIDLMVKF